MAVKAKIDVEEVRSAAAGRWVAILEQLGGLPADVLDGKHHPCPRCGGTDRFRAFDDVAEKGSVMCNQCEIQKCGDGFSALMKILGVDFMEAVKRVADYCGVKPVASKNEDPAKDLKFQPWNSQLVQLLVNKKPGISETAMLAAGAQLAQYKKKYTVVAFPIIGQDLDVSKPVGWALMDWQGNMLPVWDKDGNEIRRTKVKLTAHSKPGLIGVHAIERMKTEGLVSKVWKVEGVTDVLALWTNTPEQLRDKEVVLTNSNGSTEIPGWRASFLASFDVNVVHDADKPGEDGAAIWSQAIAMAQSSKKTRRVKLPYEIAPDHGKDIRDYFNAANRYTDLEVLADNSEVISMRTKEGHVDLTKAEYPLYNKIMKYLQIEVMEEDEAGNIRIFSTFLRKSSIIRQVSRVKHEDLLQYCGTPAQTHISSDPCDEGEMPTFSMMEVRKAIAWTASTRRGCDDRCGVGIWQGVDGHGNETKSIVLVNNTEAARWNGDQVLRKVVAPRVDGLVLDFGAGWQDWYNFDELERNLAHAANKDWCVEVIDQCVELLGRWRWKNPVVDPTILTGLVLASPIQTIWEWRPLVSVSGESKSGKSFLYGTIGGEDHRTGLLGKLAFKSSQSTEAGIRQGIANTARVPICDEFEKSKEREGILKRIFRPSTRGDTVSRGTSNQKGTSFRLRHISWITAIETGLKEQADLNRFIQLDLLLPEKDQENKLVIPSGQELLDLGQKLIAISVRYALAAKALAVQLKGHKVKGIDSRSIEGYAVPAAILATAQHMSFEEACGLLTDLVSVIDVDNQSHSDHEDLLDCILSSKVNCGSKEGMLSVAQVLEGACGDSSSGNPVRYMEHAQKLEAEGIRLTEKNELFVYHRQLSRGLLRQTPWEGQRIDQLLLRLPGAKRCTQRIAGRPVKGIAVPQECMRFEPHQETFI